MTTSQALTILSEIRTATFQNAAPLPLRESPHSQWQGFGYQIGGVRLVSRMGEIDEILKVPKPCPAANGEELGTGCNPMFAAGSCP